MEDKIGGDKLEPVRIYGLQDVPTGNSVQRAYLFVPKYKDISYINIHSKRSLFLGT